MKKIFLLVLVVLVSACVTNPYQRTYHGVTFNFRSDLNNAQNVPVYPNDQAVRDVLLSNSVNKIIIAFIDNSTENGFYAVAGFEFSYKMTVINRVVFGDAKSIEAHNVSSIAEAKNISDKIVPVVLFLGPSHANETAVRVDGNIIIVEGKGFYESSNQYTDLDLATDKLILVLMGEQ